MNQHHNQEAEVTYSYTYTYSSSEQEEIDAIKRKYLVTDDAEAEQDVLTQLYAIEKRVENVSKIRAIMLGILGLILLGVGMCCVLVWIGVWFFVGIPIGLLGIGMMAMAYPLYGVLMHKMREKYREKVLALTEHREATVE